MATTWTEAARADLDGIAHALGWSPKLLPEDKRPAYQKMMAAGGQFLFGWLEMVDLDSKEMNDAINAMAQRRMHMDPTLAG